MKEDNSTNAIHRTSMNISQTISDSIFLCDNRDHISGLIGSQNHQQLMEPTTIETLNGGKTQYLKGPHAAITARIISSLLDCSGASQINRYSKIDTAGHHMNRLLEIDYPKSGMEQVISNYAHAGQWLKTQQELLTQIFSTSKLADRTSTYQAATKITPVFSRSKGIWSIQLVVNTNHPEIISQLKESTPSPIAIDDFISTDMKVIGKGLQFTIPHNFISIGLDTIKNVLSQPHMSAKARIC